MTAVLFAAGCGQQVSKEATPSVDLGSNVGSMAEVFGMEVTQVEGYGLVGGLQGTGSAECPPQIRSYLKRYILAQLTERASNIDELINSRDTAVVGIRGTIPGAAGKGQRFDLRVEAPAGTQTTSLEDGWLYRGELRATGPFGIATKALAHGEGPIFIDTIEQPAGDKKNGYVLAGGRVLDDYPITLALRRPDYMVSRRISDMLNTRFGVLTAASASPSIIDLTVPAAYAAQKERFISIVMAMYVEQTPETIEQRTNTFGDKLAASDDKDTSEIALEAIGAPALPKLGVLLKSSNEEVRLRAARCMLNIGSDQGLYTLRSIAMDKRSRHRIAALESVAAAARRSDAASIARVLLRDENFEVRLAAYKQLRKLDDISVTGEPIAGSFRLEQIAGGQEKEIYVSRIGEPRIVLFGAPITCRDNIFVQSDDGDITINAPAGQKYVSLVRKIPGRPKVAELRSSFELSDIIRTLCEEPLVEAGYTVRSGLNVPYSTAIGLLKQMCDSGAVAAQFRAGPLAEID
jgi:hypothetical protein